MTHDAPMTPERWSAVETLFAMALERPAGERAAFLEASTGDDLALRRTVEELLTAHDRDPGFLEAAPPWLVPGPDAGEPLPERIGEYRILRALGRGGMGQVYLAAREAPDFRQEVALKVLRRGLDTDDLLRRFRAERQILATLDHPNIARLLDVGATDDGLPYFVMEYIEGTSIVEHCDRVRLGVSERLLLFRTVCSAVQHAHRSLVVHRDLKPGNILVTGAGVPKLLDFGIAKILDAERDGSLAATRAEERLLTPASAAPEQLRGDAVTTACDVYALGVLLYELLAGRHPYAGVSGRDDMERRITESAPSLPSTAVREDPAAGEVARARDTSPDALRRRLIGDLDTIVAKAMRKEPDARYPSASALAADVQRHIDGHPIEARPATFGYKVRKFAQRNRVAVAAGTGVVLLLSAFSAVTAYQSLRIRQESARVTRERDKALEVRQFLLETFSARGPDQTAGEPLTVREMLDRRAATLADAYPDDPELRAELALVLAEAYEKLGLYAEAEPLALDALETLRRLHGPEHADVASALNALGWIQRQRGNLELAEATLRDAVRTGRSVFGAVGDERLARALNDLGVVLQARGDLDASATSYRESLAMRERLPGETSVGTFVTMSNLAAVLYGRGDLEGAAGMTDSAVEGFRRLLGYDHERTVIAQGNLAAIRATQGDHEAAAAVYAELVERNRRLFGDRHPQLAFALMARANELVQLGRPAEAEPLLVESLDIAREAYGDRHERVGYTLRVLGDAALVAGRAEASIRRYSEAADILQAALGTPHREVAEVWLYRSRAYERLGRLREAERDYRAAMAGYRDALGAEHYLTARATLELAKLLLRTNRHSEARPLLDGLLRVVDGVDPTLRALADSVTAARERAGLAETETPTTP